MIGLARKESRHGWNEYKGKEQKQEQGKREEVAFFYHLVQRKENIFF